MNLICKQHLHLHLPKDTTNIVLLNIFLIFTYLTMSGNANAAIDNSAYDASNIIQEDDTLENQNGLRISVINLEINKGKQSGKVKIQIKISFMNVVIAL